MRSALDARVSARPPSSSDDRSAAALVGSACAGIIGLDARLRVTSWNAGAVALFGRPGEETLGAEFSSLLTAGAQRDWAPQIAPALAGSSATFESTAHVRALESVEVTISISPLTGVSAEPGFVAVVQKSGRAFYEQAMLQAANRECRRIAQELHDHLCQHLLGAAFSAKALADGLAREGRDTTEFHELARMINSAVQEAREVVRGMDADALNEAAFRSALESLTRASRHGIACRLECPPGLDLGARPVASHLFRIAQEAVANAVAHSKGSEIVVRLCDSADRVTLSIEDNGAGMPQPPPSTSLGLAMMKAHAHALGSTLGIDTRKSGGTCVSVTLAK